MDLSTVDILVCLGAIALLAAAAVVINAHRTTPAKTIPVAPAPDGRHHLPPGMIDGPTTRFGPDFLATMQQPPGPADDQAPRAARPLG